MVKNFKCEPIIIGFSKSRVVQLLPIRIIGIGRLKWIRSSMFKPYTEVIISFWPEAWHHIACEYKSATGKLTFYIDGNAQTTNWYFFQRV